ncbi:hypothetical protein ACFY19_02965 [Streptosporangium saharense]|uniref:hypothetical protein n=1 Tax=Streptosporangium saharense TaxID=1706840 RepID=UPI0036929C5E
MAAPCSSPVRASTTAPIRSTAAAILGLRGSPEWPRTTQTASPPSRPAMATEEPAL